MVLAERNELRRVGGEVGGAVEAVEGTKVQVVIIRPGLSENGLEYRPDVLRRFSPAVGGRQRLPRPSNGDRHEPSRRTQRARLGRLLLERQIRRRRRSEGHA